MTGETPDVPFKKGNLVEAYLSINQHQVASISIKKHQAASISINENQSASSSIKHNNRIRLKQSFFFFSVMPRVPWHIAVLIYLLSGMVNIVQDGNIP